MSLFKFVKNNVAILDVIGAYTTLKQAGHYWKGCCPFHSEKTASFTVSPNKNIFYCFGCTVGGDAIAFIEKVENCSPLEAVEYLVERFSLAIPEELQSKDRTKKAYQAPDEKKHYWDLCAHVATWCHQQLLRSPAIIAYLTQRGIEKNVINTFMLGFFPSGQYALKSLLDFVKTHNYLLDDLIAANIVGVTKATIFSPLEDRIIFPIKDHLGRHCGFGGRIFKENDTRPKYYNSKENPYFSKGSLLFGFDSAKKNIQQTNTAFLVEGYMDCIAMVQHGFLNSVATLGTACNLEHLKTLSRYCQSLYVLFDGDSAGQKAMLRLTELAWQVNLDLKVIRLPAADDPASFLQNGGNITNLLPQAEDIFMFFIAHLGTDFYAKTLHEKVQLTKNLLVLVANLEEPLKQDFLLQTAAKSFAIPFTSLKAELARIARQAGESKADLHAVQPAPQALKIAITDLKTISDLEKKLFSVIINNIEALQPNFDTEIIESFSDPLRGILKTLLEKKGENPAFDFADFFEILTMPERDITSKVLFMYQTYDGIKSFNQLFYQFTKNQWKSKVNTLKLQIAKAHKEGNEHTVKKLLSDFQLLKQKLTRGIP